MAVKGRHQHSALLPGQAALPWGAPGAHLNLTRFGVCTSGASVGAGVGMRKNGPWTQIEEGTWRQRLS